MTRIAELIDWSDSVPTTELERLAQGMPLCSAEAQQIHALALQKIMRQSQFAASKETVTAQSAFCEQGNVSAQDVNSPQKAQNDRKREKYRVRKFSLGRGRLLLIAAICALVLSLSTAAVATFSTDERLLRLLHADSQSQIAQLDQMSAQVNTSVTVDGYTVTMQETISDRHNVWILLDVEGPTDIVLNADTVFFQDTRIQMERMSSHGYAVYTLPDADPTDNKLSFIVDFSARTKLAGQKMTLALGKLKANQLNDRLEITGEQQLAEGPWEFAVSVPQQDFTVTMWQWKRLTHQDTSFLLQKIAVSPLSITLEEMKLSTNQYWSLVEEPVYVQLKDGTQLELHSSNSGSGGLGMQQQYNFPFPINLHEIEEIVYCNEKLHW